MQWCNHINKPSEIKQKTQSNQTQNSKKLNHPIITQNEPELIELNTHNRKKWSRKQKFYLRQFPSIWGFSDRGASAPPQTPFSRRDRTSISDPSSQTRSSRPDRRRALSPSSSPSSETPAAGLSCRGGTAHSGRFQKLPGHRRRNSEPEAAAAASPCGGRGLWTETEAGLPSELLHSPVHSTNKQQSIKKNAKTVRRISEFR